jgi:hypothetical protein
MDNIQRYAFNSLDFINLRVVPLPYLRAVRPSRIFNLATVTSLVVNGQNFLRPAGSQDLQCIFTGGASQYKVAGIFKSPSMIACPFNPPPELSWGNEILLKATNDNGLSYSESALEISVSSDLPRITSL